MMRASPNGALSWPRAAAAAKSAAIIILMKHNYPALTLRYLSFGGDRSHRPTVGVQRPRDVSQGELAGGTAEARVRFRALSRAGVAVPSPRSGPASLRPGVFAGSAPVRAAPFG